MSVIYYLVSFSIESNNKLVFGSKVLTNEEFIVMNEKVKYLYPINSSKKYWRKDINYFLELNGFWKNTKPLSIKNTRFSSPILTSNISTISCLDQSFSVSNKPLEPLQETETLQESQILQESQTLQASQNLQTALVIPCRDPVIRGQILETISRNCDNILVIGHGYKKSKKFLEKIGYDNSPIKVSSLFLEDAIETANALGLSESQLIIACSSENIGAINKEFHKIRKRGYNGKRIRFVCETF